jgi:hypothetical protein
MGVFRGMNGRYHVRDVVGAAVCVHCCAVTTEVTNKVHEKNEHCCEE